MFRSPQSHDLVKVETRRSNVTDKCLLLTVQFVVLNTAQHLWLNPNKSHWGSFSPSPFVFSSHCHSVTVQHTHTHKDTHLFYCSHTRYTVSDWHHHLTSAHNNRHSSSVCWITPKMAEQLSGWDLTRISEFSWRSHLTTVPSDYITG